MRLRGIDFGPVLDASGVRGFFGEGYAHHALWKPFGLSFEGSTFVAKTTTLGPREGNMPLGADLRPKELVPRCVIAKPLKGVALNAVGLSGPGAKALLETGRWQARTEPFFISFMSVAPSAAARQRELEDFICLCMEHLGGFQAPVGLQLNFSCPNVGIDPSRLIEEVAWALRTASLPRVPLMPKFNVLLPPEAAAEIAGLPACDALCVSNTLPWGALPDRIDWQGLFGSATSPLAHLGGGGLSGAPLLPLTGAWVRAARAAGVRKPINAGGGILRAADVDTLLDAGADSVFIGSMAILRPWRVARAIRRARAAASRRLVK
ncbi:MAG TPA: HisA/HisF-related TIM barrel protein [Candidatus Binatia bacterium]|jgi:dihydroorotate dehydrogenase|nr:HisA/HisF-related TIM barrel protein [Candidatus Binatia bacterium]